MTFSAKKKRFFTEDMLTNVLQIACYLSLPLVLLFVLTISLSFITTGGINTNVNETTDLYAVLMSFSFPMVLALAIIPLIFKLCIQKRKPSTLGFYFPESKWHVCLCALTVIGAAALAILAPNIAELNLSPLTVWIHFFFVAATEEIMLRGIILDELGNFTSNKWFLCLFNGILFAFVYHSNNDFLSNLLIRVPLGFILCWTRISSKSLYPAIGLHWFYNMAVTLL